MATFIIAQDVQKDYNFIQSITTRRGETGNVVTFRVYSDGLPYQLTTGQELKVKANNPFGHYIEIAGGYNRVGNEVSFKLADIFTSESGAFQRFYLEIKELGGTVITTPDVKFYVLPNADITLGNAQDYIDRVEKLLTEAQGKLQEYLDNVSGNYANFILDMTNQFNTTKTAIEKELADFKTNVINDYGDLWAQVQNIDKQVTDALATLNAGITNINGELEQAQSDLAGLKVQMDEIVTQGAMTKAQADEAYMQMTTTVVTSADWNTLTTIGTYEFNAATGTNRPPITPVTGTLLVQGKAHNANQLTQLFIGNGNLMFRSRSDTKTWTAWTKAGADIDPDIYYRTWDEVVVDGSTFAQFWKQGSYLILLTDQDTPADSPLSVVGEEPVIGWLEVNKPYLGGDTVDGLMQKVYFPTKNQAFQRIQINSVPVGSESTIEWSDWGSLGSPKKATLEEAEAGTTDDAFITPLGVKQHVDKRKATIEETIKGERDDLVITPKTLKEAIESYQLERGVQIVWGENRQLSDPNPNQGVFGISDNNKYSSTKEAEPYFTINSNGVAVVKKAGTYKLTGIVKRQFRTGLALWHYIFMRVTRSGGGYTDWDLAPFGGTVQNRNRQACQMIVTLGVGDTLQPGTNSNNTTSGTSGVLQFLNFDQFGLERLGD